MSPETELTVDEVCALLRCSKATLYSEVKTGLLVAVPKGTGRGRLQFLPSDVASYQANRRRGIGAPNEPGALHGGGRRLAASTR
jgi:hypothetical protein